MFGFFCVFFFFSGRFEDRKLVTSLNQNSQAGCRAGFVESFQSCDECENCTEQIPNFTENDE